MRIFAVFALAALTLTACEEEDEPVEDQPFDGAYSGECAMDLDGTAVTWAFELDAVYDAEKSKVSGVVTTQSYQGETLEGEITGVVDGKTFDLNLFGEGVVDSGDYVFDMDVVGEPVEWWYEGFCTSANGDSGTLFMR